MMTINPRSSTILFSFGISISIVCGETTAGEMKLLHHSLDRDQFDIGSD